MLATGKKTSIIENREQNPALCQCINPGCTCLMNKICIPGAAPSQARQIRLRKAIKKCSKEDQRN